MEGDQEKFSGLVLAWLRGPSHPNLRQQMVRYICDSCEEAVEFHKVCSCGKTDRRQEEGLGVPTFGS